METLFKDVLKQAREFFTSLDGGKKMGIIILGILMIVGSVSLVMWASKTEYKTLYTNLTPEDSQSIAQILEEGKIPYQMNDDGKTIKIPDEKVDYLRLEIAKKGVSFNSTVGYEVFDQQSFGTTSFVQKINKQRALEGELIKTIKHIKGVKRARVHLSIPESSPFVSEVKPPSASVVLEVQNGYVMDASEVRGIASLVSASIDGMRSEHVVIIDSKGKKLSENMGDRMTSETASKIALESTQNHKYETQIEEILSKVVGSGRVIAKVTAEMDYTEKYETQTTYDPENAAVVSEVNNSQKLQGSRPSPQGIPGARSNLPGENPQPGIPETRNDVDKNLVTKNYNVPSKVIKSKSPAAALKNISAAVMIDGKRVPQTDASGAILYDEEGIAKTKYEPWSEAEIENFKDIVSSAIGINVDRGDKIVIKNMEFAQEDLSGAEMLLRQQERRELVKNLTKFLIIGSLIALFIFVVVRPFVQWMTDSSVESVDDFLPKTLQELESLQANQRLPGLENAIPEMEDELNPEKIEGNLLKEKVISLVEANPSKAAQVIRNMMHSTEEQKKSA